MAYLGMDSFNRDVTAYCNNIATTTRNGLINKEGLECAIGNIKTRIEDGSWVSNCIPASNVKLNNGMSVEEALALSVHKIREYNNYFCRGHIKRGDLLTLRVCD